MGPSEGYFYSMIAAVLAFSLSLFVFLNIKRKWVGCILQFLTFILSFGSITILLVMFRSSEASSHKADAMIQVRLVEEDRNCRFETTWWIKPDNTFFSEYDKGSNDHKVEPCGNDFYGDQGTFSRIDSVCAIKANINPSLVIYFDLDRQKAIPKYNNDTIDVIDANWELIKNYFQQP